MSEDNKAIIRRWFEEVWNQNRTETIEELFAQDGIAHGLSDEHGNPIIGPASFRVFHRNFRGAFPDVRVAVIDTVAEGDKVVALCTVRATHTGDSLGFAATQKPVEITGTSFCQIVDGQIKDSWNNFDFLSLYQQLGAIGTPGV